MTTPHQKRQDRDDAYEAFNVEPTVLADGTIVRSRLEALWVEQLADCDSFKCIECVQVPLWIEGPYGVFLSNYKPDLKIELEDGSTVMVELKPTAALALDDDRQKRALELNPSYKFIVIGGYPYTRKGVTVRLLTGKQEKIFKSVSVCDVLKFLGCQCH